MEEEERVIAWLAMPARAPVLGAAGGEIGTVAELLGDKGQDIFHGILVKLDRGGKRVEVRAARIRKITTRRVYTDLTADEVDALPPYAG